MKQSRFSEEQIIGILKQQEGGRTTAEVCREAGISAATFYAWKAKFGGLSVSEAQRLRQLQAENAKLRRIVADQAIDIVALKDQAWQDDYNTVRPHSALNYLTPAQWAQSQSQLSTFD